EPLVLRSVIDTSLGSGSTARIVANSSLVMLIAVCAGVCSFVKGRRVSRLSDGLACDLRARMFDRVCEMPVTFFSTVRTGTLASRVQSEVVAAPGALVQVGTSLLSSASLAIFALVGCLTLGWQLAIVVGIIVPTLTYLAARTRRGMVELSRESVRRNADLMA